VEAIMRKAANAVLSVLLLAVAPAAAQDVSQLPLIVTTGNASVRRAPDQAFVTVSVETRARQPREAQRQNAEAMAAVQQKIADVGVPKDAVRTTGYSIQQEFDYSNGRRTPRDFAARNGLEIRLDAVERTGEILDAVVQAGATTVSGVRFELKDRAAVERDLLRHAVEDARARADAMAAGAGRTVDRVVRIDDGVRQPKFPGPAPIVMRSAAADAAPTPIDPGLIEVHAQVTLTVSIK
jgi:uncharacterized protein YggE